ncbi:MAG: biotin transporter BioY [Atribacterota bacterium]
MTVSLRSLVRASLFLALAVAVSVLFRFTATLVPFSLLPLVVLLCGLTLTPKESFLAMFGYLLLGLLGLPVFATPPFGGVGYLLKPTFGFILGFVVSAPLLSFFLHRQKSRSFWTLLGFSLLGLLFLYPLGLFYLYIIMKVVGKPLTAYQVFQVGLFPFIGFDVLKAFLAAAVSFRMRERMTGGGK